VQKAYRNEALNRSNIFTWYSRFGDVRELVEDDERGDRLKSTQTEVNIAAVAGDLFKNDHQIASRMIAESLSNPKTVVLWILKEYFCSRDFFLLHDNVPTHKAASVWQFLTQKKLQPFITPSILSTYISVRLFSVPQVENEVKRMFLRSKKPNPMN
jgi:hypothetical protein